MGLLTEPARVLLTGGMVDRLDIVMRDYGFEWPRSRFQDVYDGTDTKPTHRLLFCGAYWEVMGYLPELPDRGES